MALGTALAEALATLSAYRDIMLVCLIDRYVVVDDGEVRCKLMVVDDV